MVAHAAIRAALARSARTVPLTVKDAALVLKAPPHGYRTMREFGVRLGWGEGANALETAMKRARTLTLNQATRLGVSSSRVFLIREGPPPSNGSAEEIAVVLAQVQKRRAQELSIRSVVPSDAHNGKLLLLLVELNLMDGAASGASNRFFDEFNLPPIATWVDLRWVGPDKEAALLCWVPEIHVPNAQAGIDVNPEECMGWAREVAPDLYRDLADGVKGRVHLVDAA